MAPSKVDKKHIFSEFEDPERQELIAELIRQDSSLAELPRAVSLAYGSAISLGHWESIMTEIKYIINARCLESSALV